MTITLTPEELSNFQYHLSKWYQKQIIYVASEAHLRRFDLQHHIDEYFLRDLAHKFEQANPKPDWRSLL
jgi:hypothetical protein